MVQQKEFPLLLIHYCNQYQKYRNHTLKIPPPGIEIVCKAYENFYKDNPPIPTHYLREMLRLILKENSFQFNGKHYLQTHGTAMGTKTAVSFANIFMAHIETTILSRTVFKPTVWKRYIDDIFSLWDIISKPDIEAFIEQANLHHLTIKFTAEISDTETVFLDTVVYKGTIFKEKSIVDVKTSLRSRRLEVVGERENGRARGRHARGDCVAGAWK